MIKFIFERNFAKLKLDKYQADMEHYKELIESGYYTEAFIAMWILVEVISREIQITQRASIAAAEIANSILNKLNTNDVNTEKNNLSGQLIDIVFSGAKKMTATKRDYIFAKDVVSGLNLITQNVDEANLMFLLSSEVKQTPPGFSSRTTIRERRNRLVHRKTEISKDEMIICKPYFDYFFSLTVMTIYPVV